MHYLWQNSIINLPNRKAHTKGKACPRFPPTKTNTHMPSTTLNNAQQIQTTKTVSYLIGLHISNHKSDAGKNFDCCPQGYVLV